MTKLGVIMAKLDEAERKRRHKNVKDIIRDEIYGASIAEGHMDHVTINKSDVAKIAKRIMKRAAIGPL